MKLFRLINSDQKLSFEGDIQGNVILEPNSKVALLNANWKNKVREIDLSDQTKAIVEITMENTPVNSHFYSISLQPNIYTTEKESLNTLLSDLENSLNAAMNYVRDENEKALGLKWFVRYSESTNKIKISTQQQNIIDPVLAIDELPSDSPINFIKNNIEDVFSDNTLYKSASTFPADVYSTTALFPISYDNTESFLYSNTMNAVWQCSFQSLAADASGGILGLMLNTTDFRGDASRYAFGIKWTDSGTNYSIIEDGVESITAISPNVTTDSDDNDFLQIRMTVNKIELVIYSKTTLPEENIVLSKTYSTGNLYPILYLNDNKCGIENLSMTPFIQDEPLNVIFKNLETNINVIVPYMLPIPFKVELSQDLADFLGFSSKSLSLTARNFEWISDNVRIYEGSDAYIVELNNIQLDSYDTQQEQRKSILNVITNENNDSNFRYEASNPIFIDINNNFPLPLRNLNLKVVDDKYQEIQNEGNANLTILFDK